MDYIQTFDFQNYLNQIQTLDYQILFDNLMKIEYLVFVQTVFILYLLFKSWKLDISNITKNYHNTREETLKNKATIESFKLMVGSLLIKMEKFEERQYDIKDHIKIINKKIKEQKYYIDGKLALLDQDYDNLRSDIKIINDAIFIPDDEDDDPNDSDYVE